MTETLTTDTLCHRCQGPAEPAEDLNRQMLDGAKWGRCKSCKLIWMCGLPCVEPGGVVRGVVEAPTVQAGKREESIRFISTLLLEFDPRTEDYRDELAAHLLDSIACEVFDEMTDRLANFEDVPIIRLRDELLERSKVKRDRAKEMPDDFASLPTKCKLEGEQRGYYDSYCLADQIITEEANRVRSVLLAGVEKFFGPEAVQARE